CRSEPSRKRTRPAAATNKEGKQLWQVLRASRFAGFKFRRRHKFREYVLDFYCLLAPLLKKQFRNSRDCARDCATRRVRSEPEPVLIAQASCGRRLEGGPVWDGVMNPDIAFPFMRFGTAISKRKVC